MTGHLWHDRSHSSSWICTILTQAALCVAMYVAFYIATPLKSTKDYGSSAGIRDGGTLDFHFLSVCGGHMPRKQQTHLLKQMEKVAKAYKVQFIVNISELGEDDPLIENVYYHESRKARNGILSEADFSATSANLRHHWLGYGFFTVKLDQKYQFEQDFFHHEKPSDIENEQLHWLMRTLEASDIEWRIVVGFHPLIACEEAKNEAIIRKVYESLTQIFLRYQVNAYVSKQGCTGHYTNHRGIAYIGCPNHISENHRSPLVNENSREMHNGFLLHRVSSLEFASYFINSAGKVIFKSTLHQRGKEVI